MDRRKRRRVTVSVIAVLLIAALAVTGFFICMGKQAERIPEMSADECIRHTLGGNEEGRMAVALLKDGDVTYKLYGEDGKELPPERIFFEIGSLTKTMTAALAECHEGLAAIDSVPPKWRMMGINADSIGLSWINDRENGFIWHNGGTDEYNSYLGFSPEKNTAVVVLSNMAPGYRIPATVIGIKLLEEISE